MRILQTSRGARVLHERHVLSEILAEPGPTHSVFDVLAAVTAVCTDQGAIAMLGFAGGGMVAPLRALGCDRPIDAVDLDVSAEPVFRRFSSAWAGEVRLEKADAADWLDSDGPGYDCIIEDLSQQIPGDVVKPRVSFQGLPRLIRRRLTRRGVAVINFLPDADRSRAECIREITAPYREVRRVSIDRYANEVLIAGHSLPSARALSARLRSALWTLGSKLADGCPIRSFPRVAKS